MEFHAPEYGRQPTFQCAQCSLWYYYDDLGTVAAWPHPYSPPTPRCVRCFTPSRVARPLNYIMWGPHQTPRTSYVTSGIEGVPGLELRPVEGALFSIEGVRRE